MEKVLIELRGSIINFYKLMFSLRGERPASGACWRSVLMRAIVSHLAIVEILNQLACSQASRNTGLHQKKHKLLDPDAVA